MSVNKPLISITTATFNCASTLSRTIESVLYQSYSNIEYIIMDGQSTDETVEIAESYKSSFSERGIAYKVFSEPDKGMYDAINKAMNIATGQIIGNINGDDYYLQDCFKKVSDFYKDRGGFDLLHGNTIVETKNKKIVKRARPIKGWDTSRGWSHPSTFLANRGSQMRYKTCGNAYADFDLYLRACHIGYDVCCLDEDLAVFTFGGMSTKKSMRECLKRVKWRNEVLRNNGCSPMSYIEGSAIELVKYLTA